jgi:hypothetical protein
MFQLTSEEARSLRSQTVTLETEGQGQYRKYLPYVFTEHGAVMTASVRLRDLPPQGRFTNRRAADPRSSVGATGWSPTQCACPQPRVGAHGRAPRLGAAIHIPAPL